MQRLMEVSNRSAVHECSGRLDRYAGTLDSILLAIEDALRGIRLWGRALSLLLLLCATDEIRLLVALWPG